VNFERKYNTRKITGTYHFRCQCFRVIFIDLVIEFDGFILTVIGALPFQTKRQDRKVFFQDLRYWLRQLGTELLALQKFRLK